MIILFFNFNIINLIFFLNMSQSLTFITLVKIFISTIITKIAYYTQLLTANDALLSIHSVLYDQVVNANVIYEIRIS